MSDPWRRKNRYRKTKHERNLFWSKVSTAVVSFATFGMAFMVGAFVLGLGEPETLGRGTLLALTAAAIGAAVWGGRFHWNEWQR